MFPDCKALSHRRINALLLITVLSLIFYFITVLIDAVLVQTETSGRSLLALSIIFILATIVVYRRYIFVGLLYDSISIMRCSSISYFLPTSYLLDVVLQRYHLKSFPAQELLYILTLFHYPVLLLITTTYKRIRYFEELLHRLHS